MKHETNGTCTKACEGKRCACGRHIGKAIVGLVILVLFGLVCYNTVKINKIYTASIAQFGSEENFNKYLQISQSSGFISQISGDLAQMWMALGLLETESTAAVETDESTVEPTENSADVLDTAAALSDPTWSANAAQAKSLFGMEGTPANAIINIKSGNFKAIAGAYPTANFEAAIATLKKGPAQSDDAGNAGTLTQEQIKAVLEGAHYYANEGAEIVIVEYTDLLCPFCQRHYSAKTLENIVNADKGVALIIKNMPLAQLHPTAPLGAKGVECAGQLGGSQAYYSYFDKAFTYSTFNGSNVVEIAKTVGLDAEAFAACFTK